MDAQARRRLTVSAAADVAGPIRPAVAVLPRCRLWGEYPRSRRAASRLYQWAVESSRARNRVIRGSPGSRKTVETSSRNPPATRARDRGTVRVTGGRSAISRNRLTMSQRGTGWPWAMKYARPEIGEPGSSRSAASTCARAALSM